MTSEHRALFIIGEPGSGKSSLVRAMTEGLSYSIEKKPFWHTVYYDKDGAAVVAQLGWTPEYGDAKEFAGTDRLAFDVIEKAAKWIKGRPYPMLLIEGDRLSNTRFISGCMSSGYGVEIVHVAVDGELAEARRSKRGGQEVRWVLTRIAKVNDLLDEYQPWVSCTIDGAMPHLDQITELVKHSDVALQLAFSRKEE